MTIQELYQCCLVDDELYTLVRIVSLRYGNDFSYEQWFPWRQKLAREVGERDGGLHLHSEVFNLDWKPSQEPLEKLFKF